MNKNDYIHLFKEACGGKCNAEYNPCAFLQAADNLAALKPVAWMVRDVVDGLRYPSSLKNPEGSIKGESQPLYALDEVTK